MASHVLSRGRNAGIASLGEGKGWPNQNASGELRYEARHERLVERRAHPRDVDLREVVGRGHGRTDN
jgi:hypothetical protein